MVLGAITEELRLYGMYTVHRGLLDDLPAKQWKKASHEGHSRSKHSFRGLFDANGWRRSRCLDSPHIGYNSDWKIIVVSVSSGIVFSRSEMGSFRIGSDLLTEYV